MRLFCFASSSDENITLGVKANLWAISDSVKSHKSRVGKARKNFSVGSKGLFYSGQSHAFMVPFLSTSEVDIERVMHHEVWFGRWTLPFSILPLGSPADQVGMDDALKRWQFLHRLAPFSAAAGIMGTMVFNPIEVSEEDWTGILAALAYPEVLKAYVNR